MAQPPAAAHRGTSRRDHARALLMLGGEVLSPLIVYYGLRLAGADPWLALLIGAAVSLVVLVGGVLLRRRVDAMVLFAFGLILVGTVVGYLAADPRAVMARGSWLTAAVGLVMGVSSFTSRPALYQATLRFMPPLAAADWRRTWVQSPAFRRLLRRMTLGFAVAFLLDAGARVVMAYTLPLDTVPLIANLLLVAMLTLVVLFGKARGRRLTRSASTDPATVTRQGIAGEDADADDRP